MSLLTRISLKNRSVVALAVAAIVLIGAYAVTSLRQELIPSIEFPAVTVFTVQPGASPADVERSVTTPIETALKSLPGIEEMTSYSNEGMSVVVVMFDFGADMEANQAAATQAVDRVRPMLPTGVQPQVGAINLGGLPVVQLAVSSPLPPEELTALLGQKVLPRLQHIEGVTDVSLSGAAEYQLQLELKPLALASLGVSPQAIMGALQTANISMPAGTLAVDGATIPVRVTSRAVTLDALRALPLNGASAAATGAAGGASGMPGQAPTGAADPAATSMTAPPAAVPAAPVTLGQVADLEIIPAPASSITRTNGRPSIGISVTKAADGNVVDISAAVAELIPEFEASLGDGAVVTTVVDQAPYITQSIRSMWEEGILGAFFAVLVILLFLRNWRSTIVAGISIPLSVIVALVILWGRDSSLNMLTLSGLTIAIGRVIDDSIVVLENAYRHLQEGDDPHTAAYKGTKEVTAAITASTLTTVAVFLPLGFVSGISSEFFRPFALTVTFALLASLLVALTVVPVAVTWMLSKKQVGQRDADELTWMQRVYLPTIRFASKHKLLTILAAVVLLAGSVALTPLLKTNLMDQSAETTFSITQQMPAGTQSDMTLEAAAMIETLLADTEGVDIYQVTVGSTGGLFGVGGGVNASASRAQFLVTADAEHDKTVLMDDLRARMAAENVPGELSLSVTDASGGDMSAIEVRISADDPAVLEEANAAVVNRLKELGGLATVTSNLSERMPQIQVNVDPTKAAAAGLDATTVGGYVGLMLNGMPVGTVMTEHGLLPAYIRLPAMNGASPDTFGELLLAGSGGILPLSSVATVAQVEEPVQITHTGGERTITVNATSSGNNVGATATEIETALAGLEMPEGSSWRMAGVTEMMNDMFTTLGIAMLVAVMLVYLIMVGTFRSLLNPLILLVSIPFAAVGAILLLLVTGTTLGMPSLIGLLMLIGIVVTNAIVFLDLVEQFRDQGMDARTAVIEGGRRRLRPILMTAVATILALTPMALGLGEGSFLSRPLAVVVIGGLLTSTALTLVLVPVLYLTFDRFRRRPTDPAAELSAE
ncbi:MAG: efflux RND transporter permease subunit [Actinobacteria bacterium]|nr:efflux RND transporter permease subunit [Actinomycetota bacterium]